MTKKAFTITEILVAIMIFAVGILSVVQVFPMHKKVARLSKNSTIAIFLAQEKIEELFFLPYSAVTVGTIEEKSAVEESGDFAAFQRQTEVQYLDSDLEESETDSGLKKITSTVYWLEGAVEKSETIISLISQ